MCHAHQKMPPGRMSVTPEVAKFLPHPNNGQIKRILSQMDMTFSCIVIVKSAIKYIG